MKKIKNLLLILETILIIILYVSLNLSFPNIFVDIKTLEYKPFMILVIVQIFIFISIIIIGIGIYILNKKEKNNEEIK